MSDYSFCAVKKKKNQAETLAAGTGYLFTRILFVLLEPKMHPSCKETIKALYFLASHYEFTPHFFVFNR